MAAAFTHVCNQNGDHNGPAIRAGVSCASCQWATVEKSAQVTPAPSAPEQRLLDRIFLYAPETRPYLRTLVLPGRAPPA